MPVKLLELFGGEKSEQYNALYTALMECAKDEGLNVYDWLENTPRTSLVVFLSNKLNELGYEINKITTKQ